MLKDHVSEELVNAVRTIVKGGTFLSAKIMREIIVALRDGTEPLTRREEAMFRGLAEGRYVDEVARDLHLEPNIANEMRRIVERKVAMSNVEDLAMCLILR